MQSSVPTVEDKEVAIDSLEGLKEFLVYAKEAYTELHGSAEACASEQLCAPFVDDGKKSLEALETLIAQYTRVLDLGGFLEDEQIEEMQLLYNNILEAQDGLVTAMEYVPSEEEIASVMVAETYSEQSSAVSSERKRGTVMTVTEEDASLERVIPIKENAFTSEEIHSHLKILRRRGESLREEAEKVLQEFEALRDVPEDNEEYSEGVTLYRQFETATESFVVTLAAFDTNSHLPTLGASEAYLREMENAVNDFSEHCKEVEQELSVYFDEEQNLAEDQSVKTALPVAVQSAENSFKPNLFARNELRPFIEGALSVVGNPEFLAGYFSSPGVFEAYLKRDILEREKPSKFDKVFGIKHKSPFDTLLRDLTLAEVEHLDSLPSSEVRDILLQMDIQYEMYVAWMDAYEVMKDYVRPLPNMTFGEFYVRAMIEELKRRQ